MGGIKNKLKQLSNKVANLGSTARLGSSASGTASRRTPASRVFDDTGSRRPTEGVNGLSATIVFSAIRDADTEYTKHSQV